MILDYHFSVLMFSSYRIDHNITCATKRKKGQLNVMLLTHEKLYLASNFNFRKHWNTWHPLTCLSCVMKQKLNVVGQLETWEVVDALYSMFWSHVDMPLCVQSVVNGVIFALYVESQYQRMVIDNDFACIMSA